MTWLYQTPIDWKVEGFNLKLTQLVISDIVSWTGDRPDNSQPINPRDPAPVLAVGCEGVATDANGQRWTIPAGYYAVLPAQEVTGGRPSDPIAPAP